MGVAVDVRCVRSEFRYECMIFARRYETDN